jgi:hypothetical protein
VSGGRKSNHCKQVSACETRTETHRGQQIVRRRKDGGYDLERRESLPTGTSAIGAILNRTLLKCPTCTLQNLQGKRGCGDVHGVSAHRFELAGSFHCWFDTSFPILRTSLSYEIAASRDELLTSTRCDDNSVQITGQRLLAMKRAGCHLTALLACPLIHPWVEYALAHARSNDDISSWRRCQLKRIFFSMIMVTVMMMVMVAAEIARTLFVVRMVRCVGVAWFRTAARSAMCFRRSATSMMMHG